MHQWDVFRLLKINIENVDIWTKINLFRDKSYADDTEIKESSPGISVNQITWKFIFIGIFKSIFTTR